MRRSALEIGQTWRAVLTVLIAGMLCHVAAAEDRYLIGPRPDWADPLPVVPLDNIAKDRVPDGVFYLLNDQFSRVAEGDAYGLYARQILTEAGVQNGSEITIEFDPTYETITLHSVDVLRDGAWVPRLKPEIGQVLHREREMENFLLDGNLTLSIRIPDIRPGDVIRYDFTRSGFHPAMAGQFYRSFQVGDSQPLGTIRQRILNQDGTPLLVREHATDLKPAVDGLLMTWRVDSPPVVVPDDDVPRSLSIFPWIEVSNVQDWASVVRWALPLYTHDEPLPASLRERVAGLTGTDAEKAAAALRFVQDEIRYLGVESGIHSHQPRTPDVIYTQRSGDCKEKVLLLRNMLRELGIASYPVLVNSDWHEGIAKRLPSPYAFDHVILEIVLGGSSYFVDPTRTSQRGPLEQIFIPPYGLGLRIKEGETELTSVAAPEASFGETVVRERFGLPAPSNAKPAVLQVETTATGQSAERLRAMFASDGIDRLGRSYLDFYAKTFPGIESTAPLRVRDDPETNTFRVTEEYEIHDYWKADKTGLLIGEVPAQEIVSRLEVPERIKRTFPFALSFPSKLEVRTEVTLPETWPMDDLKTSVSNPWFSFSYKTEGGGTTQRISAKYEAHAREVPADRMSEYLAAVDEAWEGAGYQFTYRPPATAGASADNAATTALYRYINVFFVLCVMGTFVLTAVACLFLFLVPGRPVDCPPGLERLDGLRGWLVVVGIGLVVSPLLMLAQLVPTAWPYVTADMNAAMASIGPFPKNVLWLAVLFLETCFNVFFLVARVALIPLFFLKRRRFPAVFVAVVVGQMVFLIADTAAIPLFSSDPDVLQPTLKAAVQSVFFAAVWVPYMLLSKRVRATFRR